MQAVVDAEACFIAIDVGDFGRNNDASVFYESAFGKDLMGNKLDIPPPKPIGSEDNQLLPHVCVGDEGYPLLVNLMRPFARKYLTNERCVYNYSHSRARRIVECVFGILSKKFCVFQKASMLHPDKVTIVTRTCCVLHNLILKRDRSENSDIFHEILNLREDENEDTNRGTTGSPSHAAFAVRNAFVDFFHSEEGHLPWQEEYARVVLNE